MAMIDIIPYKDLIVGDKGHVIRICEAEAIKQCRTRFEE